MTQDSPRLDVFLDQGLLEKGVGLQVEHAQAEVQAGVPIAVDLVDLIRAQGLLGDGRPGGTPGAEACDVSIMVRLLADRHDVHGDYGESRRRLMMSGKRREEQRYVGLIEQSG